MGLQKFDATYPVNDTLILDDTSPTTPILLHYGQPGICRIESLYVTTTALIDHEITVLLNDAEVMFLQVPAGSGHGLVPGVEWFKTLANTWGVDGYVATWLEPVSVKLDVALTAGKTMTFLATGAVVS